MASFSAALSSELFRMIRRKKATVLLVLSFGMVAVALLLSLVVRGGLGILGGTGAAFPTSVLGVYANTILPLFVALAVTDAFTSEFAHDTMKIVITKPVTRFRIYLAKLASVGAFILANLLLVMVLSMVVTVAFFPRLVSFGWAVEVVAAYLLTLFPLLVLAVITAFFANVLKSSAGVFFLSVLLFLLSKALSVVSALSYVLPTSLLDWYKLWISSVMPFGSILRTLLVMAAYFALFTALGFRRFDRRAL